MSNPQSQDIKAAIKKCISEKGMTDKQEIYSDVVKDLDVPRPTVRRVAGVLRNELKAEIAELEEKVRLSRKQLDRIS